MGILSSGGFKRGSAEWISRLLSDPKTRQKVMDYLQGEEFKAERERLRKEASRKVDEFRERYGGGKRTPEQAARERELTVRLAEVEAESAEIRVRLSELLQEEEKIREELKEL